MIRFVALITILALAAGCGASPPPATDAHQASNGTPDLPADTQALTDTLAKAGRPSTSGDAIDLQTFPFPVAAGKKSPDGYPIYLIECSDLTKVCVGPTGEALGAVEVIARQLTTIRNADVLNPQYHCALICTDNQGNLVGAVSPQMLQFLTAQKAAATSVVPLRP